MAVAVSVLTMRRLNSAAAAGEAPADTSSWSKWFFQEDQEVDYNSNRDVDDNSDLFASATTGFKAVVEQGGTAATVATTTTSRRTTTTATERRSSPSRSRRRNLMMEATGGGHHRIFKGDNQCVW